MKYSPGRYSVTFFCALGARLHTLWTDNDMKPFTSLHAIEDFAEEELKGIEEKEGASYAIQRVIVNSKVNPAVR